MAFNPTTLHPIFCQNPYPKVFSKFCSALANYNLISQNQTVCTNQNDRFEKQRIFPRYCLQEKSYQLTQYTVNLLWNWNHNFHEFVETISIYKSILNQCPSSRNGILSNFGEKLASAVRNKRKLTIRSPMILYPIIEWFFREYQQQQRPSWKG